MFHALGFQGSFKLASLLNPTEMLSSPAGIPSSFMDGVMEKLLFLFICIFDTLPLCHFRQYVLSSDNGGVELDVDIIVSFIILAITITGFKQLT